ncbi:hypothetical protein K710_0611 [Streptococcus iniae SF1]|nr:hypothetical protein K710_0611 [Streptococcus iniae SF1]
MKKRLVFAISTIIVILSAFLAITFFTAKPQEQALKKDVSQSQVKKAKVKKKALKISQDTSRVNQSETINHSGQKSSQENTSHSTSATIGAQNGKISETQTLLSALQNRDFSSIVGTWENDLGDLIIIADDSSLTLEYKQPDGSISSAQDKIGTGVIQEDCYMANITGARFIVIPAGVKNNHNGMVYHQNSIVVGQSLAADEHPFFKH